MNCNRTAAAVLGYEAIALATGLPTISALCRKHKGMTALTVAALTVHLLIPGPLQRAIENIP